MVDSSDRSTGDVSPYADALLAAVRATKGRNMHADVVLVDTWVEREAPGKEYLCVVYDHPWWPERTGLRHVIEPPPANLSPHDLKDYLQDEVTAIVDDSVGEPLGRFHDLLVPDGNGVHWWGDGYPGLDEHPDFHKEACFGCGLAPRPDGPCPRCGMTSGWEGGEFHVLPSPPGWRPPSGAPDGNTYQVVAMAPDMDRHHTPRLLTQQDLDQLEQAMNVALQDLDRAYPGMLRFVRGYPEGPACWLAYSEQAGCALYLGPEDLKPGPEGVVKAAEEVQLLAEDMLANNETATEWPICAVHADPHSLRPQLLEGVPSWVCPDDSSVAARIGELSVPNAPP